MPVPYARHGRRHASGGEDPIPGLGGGPISALGIAGARSQSATGNLPLDFDDIYTNDASFGYEVVTSGRARYITISQEGWYRYDAHIFWDTDWGATDFPYIESSCYVLGSPDTLATAAAEFWSGEGGWIGGEQFTAAEADHHQLISTMYFNFTAADFGDSVIGIGVNVRSSGSATKNFGGGVALTRLGDTLTPLTIT